MSSKTIFGHFLRAASAVYRVTTESSIYILGFHEDRGRKFVVVRGLPGTDREHVVLRDSDPRIGEASMYELVPDAWVGKLMEIATMTSSAVTAVAAETDRAAIASVGGESPSAQATWMRPPAARDPAPAWPPRPPGIPDLPGQRSGLGRGTNPAVGDAAPRGVGYNVVTGNSHNRAAPGRPASRSCRTLSATSTTPRTPPRCCARSRAATGCGRTSTPIARSRTGCTSRSTTAPSWSS